MKNWLKQLVMSVFTEGESEDGLWPCRACGANRAPSRVEKDGRVVSCGNCFPRAVNEHIEGGDCWCEPTCTFSDPKTKKQTWIHRQWC